MPAPCRWLSKGWCQPMLSLPVEASATLSLSPLNFLAVRRAVGSCGSSGSRCLQLPSPLVGTVRRETLLRGSVGAGVPVGVGGESLHRAVGLGAVSLSQPVWSGRRGRPRVSTASPQHLLVASLYLHPLAPFLAWAWGQHDKPAPPDSRSDTHG